MISFPRSARQACHVLIVDSNRQIVDTLTDLLELRGFIVYQASCWDRAHAILDAMEVNIVVCHSTAAVDGMDCRDLIERLSLFDGTRIVVLSSSPPEEIDGFDQSMAYVGKPCGVAEFMRAIERTAQA
jgi:DNA-binding response OmpR family regulator